MEQKLLEMVATQGPLAAFMGLVIWWQRSSNAALNESVKAIQDERFAAMENHISKLEAKSDSCEEDRKKLWESNARMQERIAELTSHQR
jgi:hypothetical protein